MAWREQPLSNRPATVLKSLKHVCFAGASLAAAALFVLNGSEAGGVAAIATYSLSILGALVATRTSKRFGRLVDRQAHHQRRESTLTRLMKHLEQLGQPYESKNETWARFMLLRSEAKQIARCDAEAGEAPQDAAIDYLSLWSSKLTAQARLASIPTSHLESIESRVKSTSTAAAHAIASAERLTARAWETKTEISALETSMLELQDMVSSLYQATTTPSRTHRLQDALAELETYKETLLELELVLDDSAPYQAVEHA